MKNDYNHPTIKQLWFSTSMALLAFFGLMIFIVLMSSCGYHVGTHHSKKDNLKAWKEVKQENKAAKSNTYDTAHR